jgi:acyl carrier protein
MEKDFIFNKLQEIIADRNSISQSSVTMETNFRRNLNMDSLDIVEVVLEVEKTFDCSIDDDELEKIKDVSDLVDVIYSKK